MAKRTRTQIATDISTKLANNTAGDITPQDVREIVTDIADSAGNLIDDGIAALNADWTSADTAFTVEGDIIRATVSGNSVSVYVNETLKTTQTVTSTAAAWHHQGLYRIRSGAKFTDFKIKSLV